MSPLVLDLLIGLGRVVERGKEEGWWVRKYWVAASRPDLPGRRERRLSVR